MVYITGRYVRSSARALALLTLLATGVARADVLNVAARLSERLQKFGQFPVLGVWNGQACALTGVAPPQFLIPYNTVGTLPDGIKLGDTATVIDVAALARDTKTFRNCNDSPSLAQANFSAAVTRSLTLTLSSSFSETLTGSFQGAVGVPGVASVVLGISGSRTWSTGTSSSQSTSITVQVGNTYSAQVPAKQELDISYVVLSSRTRVPVAAKGIFDSGFYPCQHVPAGKNVASAFLSQDERTFTAAGFVEFDDAQSGTFVVSSPRSAQCSGVPPGVTISPQ